MTQLRSLDLIGNSRVSHQEGIEQGKEDALKAVVSKGTI